jgi:hypothetical protein
MPKTMTTHWIALSWRRAGRSASPLGGSGKKKRKSVGATIGAGKRISTCMYQKSNMQHRTTMHDASMSSMYEMGQQI